MNMTKITFKIKIYNYPIYSHSFLPWIVSVGKIQFTMKKFEILRHLFEFATIFLNICHTLTFTATLKVCLICLTGSTSDLVKVWSLCLPHLAQTFQILIYAFIGCVNSVIIIVNQKFAYIFPLIIEDSII